MLQKIIPFLITAFLASAANSNAEDLQSIISQGGCKGCDLYSISLREINLPNANFEGAILQDADLKDASLRNANFQHTDLERAGLEKGNYQNSNFSFAILRDADLEKSNISGSVFENAVLKNADLGESVMMRLAEMGETHPADAILLAGTHAVAGNPQKSLDNELNKGRKEAGYSAIEIE